MTSDQFTVKLTPEPELQVITKPGDVHYFKVGRKKIKKIVKSATQIKRPMTDQEKIEEGLDLSYDMDVIEVNITYE